MGWKDAPEVEPQGKKPKWAEAPVANGLPQEVKDRIAAAKKTVAEGGSPWTGVDPKRAGEVAAIDARTASGMRYVSAPEAFLANMLPGMTFGFADELVAGGTALLGGDYQKMVEGLRQQQDMQMDQQPVASIGGQITGGMVPGMAGYKAAEAGLKMAAPAVNATGLPARIGLGGLTGTMEGAALGAGTADGGDMAEGAKNMALIGGLAGLGGPLAVAGLEKGARALYNPVASALNIPSDVRASEAIAKLIKRAGMSEDDVARAVQGAADDGQGVFKVVDALGATGQRGLSGIVRQPGDRARQEVTDFLTTRQAGQGDRLSSFLSDALDAPDTAAKRVAGMTAARDATADVAYGAARSGAAPVDVRGVLGVIDDRIGPMLNSGVADDGISGTLSKYRGRLAGTNVAGEAVELANFDRIHLLRKEIGDDIGAAVRAGRNNEARELIKVQKAMDEALEAASPGFKAANADFAKASRAIDAVDAGSAATSGRVRAEDTATAWAKMTPEERAAFKAGYADPTIARIDNAATGVNKARPLSSDKTGKDLGFLASDPEKIARQIQRENAMFETNAAALGGSKTADNLADIQEMKGLSNSLIGNILTGNWGMAARQTADKLGAAATGTNPATRELIAKMLLSQDPSGILAGLTKRQLQLEGPRKITEALIRSGATRAQ